MALVAEAGRATPLVQLRQRELARAIGQFAADDVKSNRRRLGLRVDSDQARMPDALRLSLFLLVILMVAIAVAVFAKLIGVLIAAPRQDSVPQFIRRQERLATIRAALDPEHQRLAVWATVLLIKQDRAKWPAVRPCAPGAARFNAGPQARNGARKTVRAHRQHRSELFGIVRRQVEQDLLCSRRLGRQIWNGLRLLFVHLGPHAG